MKQRILFAVAFFLLTALFSNRLDAQTISTSTDVPYVLSYQGHIATTGNSVVTGTHHITASIYSDAYGSNSLWQGSYDAEIKDGIFALQLGSGKTKLPQSGLLDRPLWIGIKVDGSEEMRPLTQLTAVPYALNVPDQSITLAKLAPEVILGTGKIPTPQLDPNDWTRNGNAYNAAAGDFVGTAGPGSGDLELQSQAVKVVHYNAGGGVPNINGGAPGNFINIPGGVVGATISGGGGVAANTILSNSGVIGGGQGNTIDANSALSTIGGGDQNHIWQNSDHATVAGGGWANQIAAIQVQQLTCLRSAAEPIIISIRNSL